ncbi:MAG: hypothetical protein ACYC96_12295 [Fimbriimonadaceae bacterium]
MNAGSPSNRDLSETFQSVIEAGCRGLLWIGLLATAIGAGFLFYTCFAVSSDPAVAKQALVNIAILDKFLYAGLIALAISTTIMWWGEQVLAPLQLILAGILYTVPLWLPSAGLQNPDDAARSAMASLQSGGALLGIIAVCVLLADIVTRARDRFQVGAKADQLKLGKGVKEESDRQNVFLGKCWQLPFCRKFVREKCPIYHSKRTCWRELVGCMCEEEVIRGAMENRVIPKDALLAANMIPRNNRLTVGQKKERCKTCVIYNEHQKHKYRAWVWGILGGAVGLYLLLHEPLLVATKGLIAGMAKVVHIATFNTSQNDLAMNEWFAQGLLVVFFILGMSYAMKVLEYLIFTLKV